MERKEDDAPEHGTDPSLACAFDGPAPYVNRIYLSLTPVLGRLSFVEEPIGLPPGVPPKFRAAVTLSIGDLISLRSLLERMLKEAHEVPQAEGDANVPQR